MDAAERELLMARWIKAMSQYVKFLVKQRSQQTELAATLTVLELPNLFALLEAVRTRRMRRRRKSGQFAVQIAAKSGKPRLLERVGQVRDAAAAARGDTWNHAWFQVQRTRIKQQVATQSFARRVRRRTKLLQHIRAVSEGAYPGADYDLAHACWLLAHVSLTAGGFGTCLAAVDEAQQRFEAIERDRPGRGAERMASVCIAERSNCLLFLGRLNEAAAATKRPSATLRESVMTDESLAEKIPACAPPPGAALLPGGAGGLRRSA